VSPRLRALLHRRRAVTLLVLGTLLLVTPSCLLFDQGPQQGGPLDPFPPHGMIITDPVGQRFTDGFEILQLEGPRPARILLVTSVGGSNALRHVGTLIAGPGRRIDAVQKVAGFPPAEPGLGSLHRARGHRIVPEAQTRDELGYELLLGYEVIAPKLAIRRGIEVRYRIGSTTYQQFLPARILYCPKPRAARQCERISNQRFPHG
jgi:hypothetical protein